MCVWKATTAHSALRPPRKEGPPPPTELGPLTEGPKVIYIHVLFQNYIHKTPYIVRPLSTVGGLILRLKCIWKN